MSHADAARSAVRLLGGRWVVLLHRVPALSRVDLQDTSLRDRQDTVGDDTRARPRGDHYDVMFESTEGLETWAVMRLPDAIAQVAHRLDLHRAVYLDYEGPISGDRGEVRRVDAGHYRLLSTEDSGTLRIETKSEAGVVSTWVLQPMEPVHDSRWWLQRIESERAEPDADLG